MGVIHAVACLSLDGSGCLIGNADRQLRNAPVRVDRQPQVVPHQLALGRHEGPHRPAASHPVQAVHPLRHSLLNQADQLLRDLLSPSHQDRAGPRHGLEVLGCAAGLLLGLVIAALLARVKALLEEVDELRTENAALRDKLSLPPKTPRNSSKPPSQEMKANGETEPKPKSKPHAGAYRPLHPNPTRCREVWADCCPQCQADVTAVAQVPLHTYDWIEIPEIAPDVTRVTLYGGTCPCCRGRFKARGPQCMSTGLALRAEPARLRAVSALRSGDPVRTAGAAAL